MEINKMKKEPKHLPFNGDDEKLTWFEMIFSALVIIAMVLWIMLILMLAVILSK